MASALEELQNQIDAVRREADAEGYARAMSEMSAFIRQTLSAKVPRGITQTMPIPLPMANSHASATAQQPGPRNPRGQNRDLILKLLRTTGAAMGATEIQRRVRTTEGVKIAYSSARHALDQLTKSGDLRVANGLWMAKEMAPSTEAEGTTQSEFN